MDVVKLLIIEVGDMILFATALEMLTFYLCEQKMTSSVKASKQLWILDPQEFHQQSYPQAGVF